MVNCQVDKCGCGCTLRTGTIIIGVLNLLSGIGALLLVFQYSSDIQFALNSTGLANKTQLLIFTVISLLGLPIGALYIAGVRKEQPKWLHIGIFMHLLMIIVVSFVLIYAGISILADTKPQLGAFTIFKGITNAVFGTYFIIVVNSLRIQLEDGTGGRNYNIMGSIILFITCVWIQNNPHLLEEFDENGNNIPEEEESNRTTLTTSMIISFIHFWASVSLLLGVDKRKRSLIQVWIVYAVLFAIYAIIDNLSDTPAKMFTDDIAGGVGILFQTAIYGAFWIYGIIIVASFSKQIKFDQNSNEQQNTHGQRSYVPADSL